VRSQTEFGNEGKIDPHVDDARDYVLDDLMEAGRVTWVDLRGWRGCRRPEDSETQSDGGSVLHRRPPRRRPVLGNSDEPDLPRLSVISRLHYTEGGG